MALWAVLRPKAQDSRDRLLPPQRKLLFAMPYQRVYSHFLF